MRRALLVCLIALSAATAAAAVSAPPRDQLVGFVCRRAANQLNRAIAVTAVMRPVAGTQRMAMMFRLQRRTPASRSFSNVNGGDLGRWRYPTNPPTLGQRPDDVWRVNKEVVNLAGPARYRLVVTFRWLGMGGVRLAQAVLPSQLCYQLG
jgi:hypothetical protein